MSPYVGLSKAIISRRAVERVECPLMVYHGKGMSIVRAEMEFFDSVLLNMICRTALDTLRLLGCCGVVGRKKHGHRKPDLWSSDVQT